MFPDAAGCPTQDAKQGVGLMMDGWSSAQNYPTASLKGHLLADGLNDWLKKGLDLGSFDSETLIFKTICINPRSVQPKQNGLGCIVMDLSAHPLVHRLITPHLGCKRVSIDSYLPISLNVSRDQEKFKISRVSTIDVLNLS